MPSETHPTVPHDGALPAGRPASEVSRRSMLRSAAGAGAAGLAATTLVGMAGPALASTARPASRDKAGHAESQTHEPADATDVVVHVRDARSGEMDIFSGDGQTRVHDPELAARLVRKLG